ncbi:MAG: hypothetical protein ACKPE6_07305, partial [Gammaproteobacteria bacterium]
MTEHSPPLYRGRPWLLDSGSGRFGYVEATRYKAFISYSHRDTAAVRWLHRKLEGYRVPKALRGTGVPERLTPIFRDR